MIKSDYLDILQIIDAMINRTVDDKVLNKISSVNNVMIDDILQDVPVSEIDNKIRKILKPYVKV